MRFLAPLIITLALSAILYKTREVFPLVEYEFIRGLRPATREPVPVVIGPRNEPEFADVAPGVNIIVV